MTDMVESAASSRIATSVAYPREKEEERCTVDLHRVILLPTGCNMPRKKRKTALVPRVIFGTVFVSVVPACVTGCGGDTATSASNEGGTGSSTGSGGFPQTVAAGGFGTGGVAAGGFTGVGAAGFGTGGLADADAAADAATDEDAKDAAADRDDEGSGGGLGTGGYFVVAAPAFGNPDAS
jgi:hypothetical protein